MGGIRQLMDSKILKTAGVLALIAVAAMLIVPGVQAAKGDVQKAVCVLTPTEGSDVHGIVTFTKQDDGVLIEAHVMGLEPNSKHGIHIHAFGDISAADGTAAGGHYNPDGNPHACPPDKNRHMGDLGNIEADANGHGMYKRVDSYVKLNGGKSIIGHGMIIHAGEDDCESQPTGAAGGRAAQGVIGIAKSEM